MIDRQAHTRGRSIILCERGIPGAFLPVTRRAAGDDDAPVDKAQPAHYILHIKLTFASKMGRYSSLRPI